MTSHSVALAGGGRLLAYRLKGPAPGTAAPQPPTGNNNLGNPNQPTDTPVQQ